MSRRLLPAVLCLTCLASCAETAPSVPDAVADLARAVDAPAAEAQDATPDAGAGAGDAAADADTAAALPACVTVPTAALPPLVPQRKKFGLALFHYNVEYVIGGLEATGPDGKPMWFMDNPKNAGWTDAKTEDYIVRETLLPILQLYDKHPGWGVNIELQSYLVEVMAARHPATLALLRTLAQRGQVEIVSFHHNAQFFLAFPRDDLDRSIVRVKEVFAQHCLPLSGAVFNQEGQAGEGRQRALLDHGYSVGVFPKNLWRYVHKQADSFWPLYTSEAGDLIVGAGGVDPAAGVDVAWTFLDDGELRAVTDKPFQMNPYFAPRAPHAPERVAEFEAQLAALEAAGYVHLGITDYVRHLKARGVQPKPAPPLLDGTWQAPSTKSVRQWMGGQGLWFTTEADNRVRTGNAEARMWVATLQVLHDLALAAGKAGTSAGPLRKARELLWRAQVSDTSGINPWAGEVAFGIAANEQARAIAQVEANALAQTLGKVGGHVDLNARTLVFGPAPLEAKFRGEPKPPLALTVTAPGRDVAVQWTRADSAATGERWRVTVEGKPKCADCADRLVEVAFPRTAATLAYSPALLDAEVRTYPLAAFEFSQGEAWLPLANGLIGLGDDWWVIKHVRSVHVAARVAPDSPFITFHDGTAPDTQTTVWTFEIVHGSAAVALAVANRLNVWPIVQL
ncbi:MAG: hypothetical protein EXR79_09370 [Myxococcales bacterium]|nr:hypothetical protein [Myxococcales bacterium]